MDRPSCGSASAQTWATGLGLLYGKVMMIKTKGVFQGFRDIHNNRIRASLVLDP